MSPAKQLSVIIEGLVDHLVEDPESSRDAVLDALLDIETHCQEWREALASDARREALDGAGDGE